MEDTDIIDKLENFKVRTLTKIMQNQKLFLGLYEISKEIQEKHERWYTNNCLYIEVLGLYFYIESYKSLNEILLAYDIISFAMTYDNTRVLLVTMAIKDYNNSVSIATMHSDKFAYDHTNLYWTSICNIFRFSDILPSRYIDVVSDVLLEKYISPELPINDKHIMLAISFIKSSAAENQQTLLMYEKYKKAASYIQDKKQINIVSFAKFYELLAKFGRIQYPSQELHFWSPKLPYQQE